MFETPEEIGTALKIIALRFNSLKNGLDKGKVTILFFSL